VINSIAQNGSRTYGVTNYVVDTTDDISKLPTYCKMGSSARVIATGDLYLLNSEKEWIKQPASGSGSGGSSSSEGDITILNTGSSSSSSSDDSIVIL